mmetsp:Transcript_49389/g.138323  ORF Transcript_49389/g.138323 Transcript_49389/m.138323 type:complete len:151 (-) Transcript_49389:108-560(-)
MARSAVRCLLILASAALVLQLLMPRAFVSGPPPQRAAMSSALVAGALASAASALPAWASSPEVLDAQLLLAAREVGGKFAKSKGLVMPVPEEEGFSDAQVALCLVIALVCGILAWNLGLALQTGLQPQRWTKKKGGYITPLVKRFIEMTD